MKLLLCFVLAAGLPAAELNLKPDPVKAGMNPTRIAQIRERMQSYVERGTAAGIVTLVARHGQVADFTAVGYQDREAKIPMRRDTIFQIKSQTKSITCAAAMILVEEGRLSLMDPIEKYLPEFQGKKILLIQLMSHTSGLPPTHSPALGGTSRHTLAEVVAADGQIPLEYQPGKGWDYSDTGMAAVGRIVEVVSGMPYAKFVEERILKPLGMQDTFFFPPPEKRGRIAAAYTDDHGTLKRAETDLYREGWTYTAPEGGLFSTTADLAAFYQMMLSRGSLGSRRILSPFSVAVLTEPHTGEMRTRGEGNSYGLGWYVIRTIDGNWRFSSVGSFGHGGAFRTYGIVDPAKDMLVLVMMQRTNGGGDQADEINSAVEIAGAAIEQ